MPVRLTQIGPTVQAIQHHHTKIPQQVKGEHLWIVVSMYKVTPVRAAEYHLDTENLLTIEGPGCYWCEETWSPEMAARPCRG